MKILQDFAIFYILMNIAGLGMYYRYKIFSIGGDSFTKKEAAEQKSRLKSWKRQLLFAGIALVLALMPLNLL